MTRLVSVSTELPLSADQAFAKAHKIETMEYVMAPILGFRVSAADRARADEHEGGLLPLNETFTGRLVLFGAIPLWKHHLTIVADGDHEIYTNESSGPARTWNHRLTFEPIDEHRCRYTDEIETDDGVLGAGTALFIKVFFRHRHRRWRRIAPLLAD